MRTEPSIGRATLSRQAYETLRSRILSRRLSAGSKLVVRELAEDLDLSSTPVKEALAALEREGLVELLPHRGYFVPKLGLDDIEEIYALREVLEGLAARLAAEREHRKRHLNKLRRLQAEQEACGREGDLERYGDLDMDFHRALWEAAGNGRLLRTAETLIGQVRLLISTSAQARGRLEASVEEQARILDALENGEPEAAEETMRRHVRQAGEALLQHLRNHPDDDG